ncbi:MAG: MraY family glycosyltransferase [Actinomycetota bacterium]
MVGVAAAFLIALGCSIGSIWVGPALGLVDSPAASALKVHTRPTPLLGGIGVFSGLHIGMLIEGIFDPVLFVATSAVLTLGLVDDAVTVSPRIRLAVEVAASVFLVLMINPGTYSVAGMLGGVTVVVVAINAVNLLDGLDGLVASVTIVSGLGLALAGGGGFGDPELGLVIAASAAGFLIVNWQPARVFLGDNGAYTIGMVLGYGILVGGGGHVATTLYLTLGTLGVFLIDLITTIARRVRNASPVFSGDRSHIYDQLRDRGWSVRSIAVFAAVAQAALVALFIGLTL